MNANILIMLALGALLVFMMVNSRRKQKQRQEQISNELVPGARVMTGAGIFGTVVSVDDETHRVTIESGPGTLLIVHRQAIGQVEAPETAGSPIEGDDEPASPVQDSEPTISDADLDAHNEARRKNDDAEGSDEK